uniref:Uncharacterized protein n=1 Tax=Xenopus tropicalis TaxID=8364 RepID=A0A1B8Y6D3_XENTR
MLRAARRAGDCCLSGQTSTPGGQILGSGRGRLHSAAGGPSLWQLPERHPCHLQADRRLHRDPQRRAGGPQTGGADTRGRGDRWRYPRLPANGGAGRPTGFTAPDQGISYSWAGACTGMFGIKITWLLGPLTLVTMQRYDRLKGPAKKPLGIFSASWLSRETSLKVNFPFNNLKMPWKLGPPPLLFPPRHWAGSLHRNYMIGCAIGRTHTIIWLRTVLDIRNKSSNLLQQHGGVYFMCISWYSCQYLYFLCMGECISWYSCVCLSFLCMGECISWYSKFHCTGDCWANPEIPPPGLNLHEGDSNKSHIVLWWANGKVYLEIIQTNPD